MRRFFKKVSKKVGLAPGTLIHIGKKKVAKVKITLMDYYAEHYEEKEIKTVEECFPFKEKPTTTWINIDGIHQIEIIDEIGKHFEIHPLVLEDIVNTDQRPKMEDYQNYIFIVLKMLSYDDRENQINAEQICIVYGTNFVISFQEKEGDVFSQVRERIRKAKGRFRKLGADYLVYALIDAVVDHYFLILEKFGEKIESLEEELMREPTQNTLQQIHFLKREMIFLRRSVWPLRELINGFLRRESPLVQESTIIYFRDVYDHTIQVIDTIESFRDMVSGMLDTYLSSISNRMNEVMRVLTIIATIFIPLSFVAGIYGMNFEFMPELKWQWVYPWAFWLVIIGIAGFMMFYFKRKRWL